MYLPIQGGQYQCLILREGKNTDYLHRTVFTMFLLCIGLQMVFWNHLHQQTSIKFIT